MFYILPAVLLILFLSAAVKILREYERGVVFRLGSVLKMPKGSGLVIIIPVIDRLRRVSLRLVTIDVPPQDVITAIYKCKASHNPPGLRLRNIYRLGA